MLGQHQLLDEGGLAHSGCTSQQDRVAAGHQQVQQVVVAFHLWTGKSKCFKSVLAGSCSVPPVVMQVKTPQSILDSDR